MFTETYKSLFSQVDKCSPSFSFKLLKVASRFAGKQKLQKNILIDKDALLEKVFLQLLEFLDSPKVTSNEELI